MKVETHVWFGVGCHYWFNYHGVLIIIELNWVDNMTLAHLSFSPAFDIRFTIQHLTRDSLFINHVWCIRECADEACKLQVTCKL